MKIEKNKIVFASVLVLIIIFIVAYSLSIMDGGKGENSQLKETQVPKLEQQQKEYNSKLEAVNDVKEDREKTAPSVYDEKFLDSTGVYDPNLLDKEKKRMVDSIYQQGRIDYTTRSYRNDQPSNVSLPKPQVEDSISEEKEPITTKELALEQQLFFASDPRHDPFSPRADVAKLQVVVNGTQTIKANDRLQLRLLQDTKMGNTIFPKNTLVYAMVSFQPNRVMLKILNIDHRPVKLAAYDFQDGLEGIYIKNSFGGEVVNEVIGDVVDDINIAGVPQISGIQKIFKRNFKNVRVTVANNYQMVLMTP